jgi:hypothetical protein
VGAAADDEADMGAFLLALSVVLVFVGSRISRGHALAATTAVGYGYGILRANYPDGISHFMFDAAVATLYLTEFFRRGVGAVDRGIVQWALALCLWAILMIPLGLVVGRQPLVIQLVGLRSTIFFLPMLIVGARLVDRDLLVWARFVVGLNLMAFVVGVAEYQLGVDVFYPMNAVTQIIYSSNDIAGHFMRIPSTFINAHAYGGVMMMTLPLVGWRAVSSRRFERVVSWIALAATVAGPFLCGARQPVVQMGLVLLLLLAIGRMDRRFLIPMLLVGVIVGAYVGEDERLQRIATLSSLDYVSNRFEGSVNSSFLEVVVDYPLGAGLASAAGTSIPFFLADLAETPIGLENEYSRLALELGVPGLLVWLIFLAWTLVHRRPRRGASLVVQGFWSVALVMWSSAVIGTGILTTIPGTLLLMTSMGFVVGHGARGHVGTAPAPAVVAVR